MTLRDVYYIQKSHAGDQSTRKRNPKTDIVIHSWPWSGQQKPPGQNSIGTGGQYSLGRNISGPSTFCSLMMLSTTSMLRKRTAGLAFTLTIQIKCVKTCYSWALYKL